MTMRIQRFMVQMARTRHLSVLDLLAVIRNRQNILLCRLAALRHLIARSDVTHLSGLVYLERKRLVRRHYQI